jgi:hypothetical protein
MIWAIVFAAWVAFWAGFVAGVLWYGWRDRRRYLRELREDRWRMMHGVDRACIFIALMLFGCLGGCTEPPPCGLISINSTVHCAPDQTYR